MRYLIILILIFVSTNFAMAENNTYTLSQSDIFRGKAPQAFLFVWMGLFCMMVLYMFANDYNRIYADFPIFVMALVLHFVHLQFSYVSWQFSFMIILMIFLFLNDYSVVTILSFFLMFVLLGLVYLPFFT